jgi:hypothetical protein
MTQRPAPSTNSPDAAEIIVPEHFELLRLTAAVSKALRDSKAVRTSGTLEEMDLTVATSESFEMLGRPHSTPGR